MKKLITYSIIPLLFSFVIITSSCSKSDSGTSGGGTTVTGTTSFSVNGSNFTADSVFVNEANKTMKAYQNITSPTNGKLLVIAFASLAAGTYNLNPMPPTTVNLTIGSTVNYTSQSGTVTITQNTGSAISGNFSAIVEGGLPLIGSFANVKIR